MRTVGLFCRIAFVRIMHPHSMSACACVVCFHTQRAEALFDVLYVALFCKLDSWIDLGAYAHAFMLKVCHYTRQFARDSFYVIWICHAENTGECFSWSGPAGEIWDCGSVDCCHFGKSISGQFVDMFGLRGILFVMLIEIHKYRCSILPDCFCYCFRIVGFHVCYVVIVLFCCISVQPLMCSL